MHRNIPLYSIQRVSIDCRVREDFKASFLCRQAGSKKSGGKLPHSKRFRLAPAPRRSYTALLCSSLILIAPCLAEEKPPSTPSREQNKAEAARRIAEIRQEHGDDANYLFRSGLYASHGDREVHIFAEAATVSVHDPIEFFLIGETSGHDYEALAISFAKPSDIDAALQFIGMKPGHPIDIEAFRMWPKGDNVTMSVLLPANGAEPREIRVEELLVDDRTDSTFGEDGFLFVGSRQIPDRENPDLEVYAADVLEPNSIAANYNEPRTVLDVAVQRSKGEQYRHLSRNPDLQLEPRQLVIFKLSPGHKPGRSQVRDLVLEIASSDMARLSLALHSADGALVSEDPTLPGLLASLEKIVSGGGVPYVQVQFDPQLSLLDTKTACAAISELEGNKGIRVEPPPSGHAYYKAFLPREAYRTPAERPTQPWEIHLEQSGDGYSVKAVLTHTIYGKDIMNPEFKREDYAIDSTAGIAARLKEVESKLDTDEILIPRVLIFYAPNSISYGDLGAIMAPLLKEYPIVYVFGDGNGNHELHE
jgi:hypothetical protein